MGKYDAMGGDPRDNENISESNRDNIHEGTEVKSLAEYPGTVDGLKKHLRSELDGMGFGLQGIIAETFTNILSGIGQAIGGVFTGLGELFTGVVDGVKNLFTSIGRAFNPQFTLGGGNLTEELTEAVKDGQQHLLTREDLIDELGGYCAAYLGINVDANWGSDGKFMDIPYKKQLGPAKGIHIDPKGPGMVLETAGFFVVYAKLHAYKDNQLEVLTNKYAYLEVVVTDPNGNEYSVGHLSKFMPTDYTQTVTLSWPVVTPGPGYKVHVRALSSEKRWWRGGAKYSTLHIVQHSTTAKNLGADTVANGTREEYDRQLKGGK